MCYNVPTLSQAREREIIDKGEITLHKQQCIVMPCNENLFRREILNNEKKFLFLNSFDMYLCASQRVPDFCHDDCFVEISDLLFKNIALLNFC